MVTCSPPVGCQKYLVHVLYVSLMCRDWRSCSTLARLVSSLDVELSIYPSEPQIDRYVTILSSWYQTSGLVERESILHRSARRGEPFKVGVLHAGRDLVEAYLRSLESTAQRTPRVFVPQI